VGQHPFQNFVVRFKRGDTVFDEGDKGRTMFIVQSGLVGLYQQPNGDRRHLGTLEKGDFFGEMSILEGLPRMVSAVAEEDAELIEINHTVFDKMIRGNIEIAIRMLRKLSIRLRESESRALELQTGGARPSRRLKPNGERPVRKNTVSSGARLESEDSDMVFALDQPDTLVGRYDPVTQQKPDIDLTDLDLRRTVSRQHARILQGDDGYTLVEEVGALNGTSINGQQLTAGQIHPIHDGDKLEFGSVAIVFHC